MCRELLRILADPARIFSEPWRFLLQSWLQNGTAFANVNAKKFSENHPKMIPKPPKYIKITQNGARSKKIAPRIGKEPKKGQTLTNFWTPLGIQNQPKSKKKGSRKSMIFSTPFWSRLCLILGSPRHPKSRQNDVNIGRRPVQTHFRPDCIFCSPCQ